MKQIFGGILSLIAVLSGGTLAAHAIDSPPSTLLGQKQTYQVVLRSDGTVVSYAKLVFGNTTDKTQKEIGFMLPKGVKADGLEVIQIIPPTVCAKYADSQTTTNSVNPSADTKNRQCLEEKVLNEYLDAGNSYGYDYNYNYSSSQLKYQLAKTKQSGQKVTVILPNEVSAQQTGVILVSYRTKSMVEGSFMTSTLHYKTLAVDAPVNQAKVYISVDDDLFVKDRSTKGTYTSAAKTGMQGLSVRTGATENKAMDRFVQNMEYGGGAIERTATSLAKGETYEMSIVYADAAWKLYVWWIIGGILAVALLIAGMTAVYRKVYK